MKRIKQTILIILILTTVGCFSSDWLYRCLVTYKSVGTRANYLATNKELTDYINASIEGETNTDIQQIVKLGLLITSKRLNFTAYKNEIDPNKLINTKTAHCIGYASFFTTTCNYLLKKYKLSDKWVAKQQIGQLYFLGINMHKYLHSAFFKDHDFVIIENKITGEILAVDPTISDYLYIVFVNKIK
jgi:hypothetical protein